MKKFLKEAVQFSLVLLIALLISLFIVTFIGQRTVVDGESMENTLFHGDNLIVDKTDDYILLGIIIVLMLEGCDDYILLAALGYLFIMGIM